MLLCVTLLGSGCATWSAARGEASENAEAVDQAARAVATAKKHARFELAEAYDRRGMTRAARSIRKSFEGDPAFEVQLRQSRARALLAAPRSNATYRRMLRFRAEHPDVIDTSEYVDFLVDVIEAINRSPERLDAMRQLLELRPEHDAVTPEDLRRERVNAIRRYLRDERYREATHLIEKMKSASGDNASGKLDPSIHLLEAEIYARTGPPERLQQSLTKYVLQGDSKIANFTTALSLAEQYATPEVSLEWLDSVVDKLEDTDLDLSRVYFRRATFRAQHGASPERVHRDLERALANSENVGQYVAAYEVLREMGSPATGDDFLEKLASSEPGLRRSRFLFEAYAERGMREAAMSIARAFVGRTQTAASHARVAEWMKDAGWTNDARDWTREALRRDPDNWIYAVTLYRLARGTGSYRDARLASRRLVEMSEDSEVRLKSLASEFEKHGEIQRSVDLLWEAFEIGHKSLSNANKIASLEVQLGHPEKALEAYEISLRREYVSARHWQLAALQIDTRIGLDRALPFYETAAEMGETTHLAAYLKALQRSGQFDDLHRHITRFLAEHSSSATSIDVLAARLNLDELPSRTRRDILDAYALAGGKENRLSQQVLQMYGDEQRWSAALEYMRRLHGDSGEDLLTPRVTLIRRRHPRYRIEARILDGLLEELERSTPPPSALDEDQLYFAAALHRVYVRTVDDLKGRATVEATIESQQAAKAYFAELSHRAQKKEYFDEQLFSHLISAGLHDTAEEYLLEMREVVEERIFWPSYTELLRQQGRLRAAAQTSMKTYEVLEPDERAGFAMNTADAAVLDGDYRTAEDFFLRAIAAADHEETPTYVLESVSRNAYQNLGHLLLQDGRLRAYLDVTEGYMDRLAIDGRLLAEPENTEELTVLWNYGHRDAYIERVERVVESFPNHREWSVALALAYAKQGDVERAMDLVPRFSEDGGTLERFARQLVELDHPEEALAALASFDTVDQPPPATHVVLRSELLLRMGRTGDAASALVELQRGWGPSVGARFAQPAHWRRLARVIEDTGARSELFELLGRRDASEAEAVIANLEGDGPTMASARDLSDLKLQIGSSSSPRNQDPRAAIDLGLGWIAARHFVESGAGSSQNVRFHSYWSVRDELVRMGLLSRVLDKNSASNSPSALTSQELARFLLLDDRRAELQAHLKSSTLTRDSWFEAMAIGDVDRAIELRPANSLWTGHPYYVYTGMADISAAAALTGHSTEFAAGSSNLFSQQDTDAARDTMVAFETARRISEDGADEVFYDIRQLILRLKTRKGRHRDQPELMRRLIAQIGVAALMGYRPEAASLLENAGLSHLSFDAARKSFAIREQLPDRADLASLPDGVLADFAELLVHFGRAERARQLVNAHSSRPFYRLEQSELSQARLDIAHATGDEEEVQRFVDASLDGLLMSTTSLKTARKLALRAGDFDAVAQAGFFGGRSHRRGRERVTTMVLSSLDRPDLVDRYRLRLSPPVHTIAPDGETRGYWPPVASLDYHRHALEKKKHAYPADRRVDISSLLLELLHAPIRRGRPSLQRFVEGHSDDHGTLRELVDALAEHDLHVEIAKWITPHADFESLPALTNRTLFEAAIRTGRSKQAKVLADILLERLPDISYVASDLANSAVEFGDLELARALLARAKQAGPIPYTQFVRARLELRGDTPQTGVDLAHDLLDRRDLAPADHCPLLVDAMQADEIRLERRLLRALVLLPTQAPHGVAGQLLGRAVDCFVDAGLASEGLRLLETEFPHLADQTLHGPDPLSAFELARLARLSGQRTRAYRILDRTELSLQVFGNGWVPIPMWREKARTALSLGRIDEARRCAGYALETQSRAQVARALVVFSDIHLAEGERGQARNYLRAAYALETSREARNRLRIRLMRLRTPS